MSLILKNPLWKFPSLHDPKSEHAGGFVNTQAKTDSIYRFHAHLAVVLDVRVSDDTKLFFAREVCIVAVHKFRHYHHQTLLHAAAALLRAVVVQHDGDLGVAPPPALYRKKNHALSTTFPLRRVL